MDRAAARVDDVGNVPVTLLLGRHEKRFVEVPDHARRIVAVEQQGTDAIAAHRPDSVREEQPARFGFERRSAVADLHELPRKDGLSELLRLVPEVAIFRGHQIQALAVDARDHHVRTTELAREHRHALVLRVASVERDDVEAPKVRRFDKLRQNAEPVVRGIRGVIDDRTVIIDESYEARVFDAPALVLTDREDDAFGEVAVGREVEMVVGSGQPEKVLGRFMKGIGLRVDAAMAIDGLVKLVNREGFRQVVEHGLSDRVVGPHLDQLEKERAIFVPLVRHRLTGGGESGNRIDGEIAGGVQDAAAKLDRRNVPFAARPQAQDDPLLVTAEVRLIRMCDDARVEQGHRLDRVFAREVGSDQQSLFRRDGPVVRHESRHAIEVSPEDAGNVTMPR